VPKLPVVSSRQAIKAFQKIGYEFNHQTGSHLVYRRTEPPHVHLSIPERKELAKGTLRSLIRQSGITVEEFINLLD